MKFYIYIYICVKIVKCESLVPIFLNMASRTRISKAYKYYFISIETRQASSFLFFFSSLFFINFNNDTPDSRDIVIASSKRALSRSCRTHWRIRIALPSKFPFLLKNNIQKRCQETAIVPIHTDSSRWIHYRPVRVCEITDVLACISSKSFDSS